MQAGLKRLDTMPRDTRLATPPAASPDWRADAERKGMEAFEAAVAEPQSTPEPLSWLWRTSQAEPQRLADPQATR
jgi:hypothetical protein